MTTLRDVGVRMRMLDVGEWHVVHGRDGYALHACRVAAGPWFVQFLAECTPDAVADFMLQGPHMHWETTARLFPTYRFMNWLLGFADARERDHLEFPISREAAVRRAPGLVAAVEYSEKGES